MLKLPVPFDVGRIVFAVPFPVVGIPGGPVLVIPGIVLSVVGILVSSPLLRTPPAFTLAFIGRTIFLVRCLGVGTKFEAA